MERRRILRKRVNVAHKKKVDGFETSHLLFVCHVDTLPENSSPFHALHNLSVLPSYTISDAAQTTELTRSIMTDDTHTFRDNLRSGVGILGRDTLVTCEAHHGFTTTASSDGKHTTDAFVEHF